MHRAACLFILFLGTISAWATPQSQIAAAAPSTLEFEVATIKPSAPEARTTIQIQPRSGRLVTGGTTLLDVLKYAYSLNESQVAGGPQWLRTQRFDIAAQPPAGVIPTPPQIKQMAQALVADRFALRLHHQQMERPVYAITLAKSGPKLTPSVRNPDSVPTVGSGKTGLTAVNASIADIANYLQRYMLERPVVDRTGLRGRYDIRIEWQPDDASNADQLSRIFTALESVGLKVAVEKAPVDVLVIDRVEEPTPN